MTEEATMNQQAYLHQQALQARCCHPSGESTAFPASAVESSLAARFEAMVARYPNRLAVKMAEMGLTYSELNGQANRVAHAVLAHSGDLTCPIILLFSHTPLAVIALFGVLKAGGFYTPFDPTQPLTRLTAKAMDSMASLILTDRHHLALATAINARSATVICIDDLADEAIPTNLEGAIPADTPALLLYTSGSTGQPKGIRLDQRALLHRVKRQMAIVHLSPADRCACVHTYDAIAGLRDLLCPLLNGATTYLFDLKTRLLAEFPAWVQEEKITILGFVTPLFRQLLNLLTAGQPFTGVRLICIGGDTLYRQDVERYRHWFPTTCILYNSLGATETAGGFCYYLFDHQTPLPADPLPVGYPMLDMQMLILDEAGEPLPPGSPGEIALATRYLAQDYWQQPEHTTARFRWMAGERLYATGDSGLLHADGCLIHLGRLDHQVKIRGYRVELSEIERTLLRHPALQEAVVVAHASANSELQLLAYWVAKPAMTVTAAALTTWLNETLPTYMIPNQIIELASLPLTPSGKLDRRALPGPDTKPTPVLTAAEPRTATEQMLAQLWCELLHIPQIGIHDHFFQLGAHSLLAVQMLAQVERQFGTKPSLGAFFVKPTIAHLAHLLSAAEAGPAASAAPAKTTLSDVQQTAITRLHQELMNPSELQSWQTVVHHYQWHRRRRAIRSLAQTLPPDVTYQTLALLCHSPWWTNRVYPKQIALMQEFLALLAAELPADSTWSYPQDAAKVIAKHLLYNILHHYQLTTPSKHKQPSAAPIVGLELLAAAKANGQGIVLVQYHHTLPVPLDLARFGPLVAIGEIQHYLAHFQIYDEALKNSLFANQLNAARQHLAAGGIMRIAPDGHHGASAALALNFMGRRRHFFTSFAELTLLTEAAVIAVICATDEQGRMGHQFVALDVGAATMSHAERVKSLVTQYVAILRRSWTASPWLVPWYQVERHLAYPPAGVNNPDCPQQPA